ncbi:hypothetical protein D3C86_1454070 [compost metagenome]
MLEHEAAVQASGQLARDERPFDGEGARAAHGIQEGHGAVVAREQESARGEVLAQGGLGGGLAVAAAVEVVAARVEREGDAIARDPDLHPLEERRVLARRQVGDLRGKSLLGQALADGVAQGGLDQIVSLEP